MSKNAPVSRRLAVLLLWPLGVGLTSWRYMWRTTPMRRVEFEDACAREGPPGFPEGLNLDELLLPEDGWARSFTGAIAFASRKQGSGPGT
jgi:hypothetical protein